MICNEARLYTNDSSTYDLLNWINEGRVQNGKKFASWVNNVLIIPTLEGDHIASVGDMIIKGVAGEFYPCKFEVRPNLTGGTSQITYTYPSTIVE